MISIEQLHGFSAADSTAQRKAADTMAEWLDLADDYITRFGANAIARPVDDLTVVDAATPEEARQALAELGVVQFFGQREFTRDRKAAFKALGVTSGSAREQGIAPSFISGSFGKTRRALVKLIARLRAVPRTTMVVDKTPAKPVKWWLYAIPATAVALLGGALYVRAKRNS